MKKILLIILFFLPVLVFCQDDLKNYERFMPESSCGEIIHYSYYSASFCGEYKISEWTIHYLTPNRLGSQQRSNNFKQDPRLNGRDASLSDFRHSGYDRGHMVPAADMTFDRTRMAESFYMTNMAPQTPAFNRGGWSIVENRIRDWVLEFDTVAIITGSVIGENPDDFLGYAGTVAIPKYFYKVFIDIKRKRSIAFLMPNATIIRPIEEYIVSIDMLENITGLDFFYKLSELDELTYEFRTK